MFRSLALLTACLLCVALLCSCVTDEEKDKMREDLSSAMAANSSSSDSSDSEPESESAVDSDHELSVPDDWKDYTGGGSNPDKYPWEDDKNIPDLEIHIEPDPNGVVIGEDDTGERGDTWEIPEFNEDDLRLPFNDDDINMPPMP